MTKTIDRCEIYEATDGWRWRIRAANGEIIANGEAYHNVQDILNLFSQHFPQVDVQLPAVDQ